MLPSALTSLLVNILYFFVPNRPQPPSQALQLELRHLHAVSPDAHVVFSDVQPTPHVHAQPNASFPYTLLSRRITTFRPPSFEAVTHARTRSILFSQNEQLRWDEEEIIGPDVESRETLLQLAKMTNNAYVSPDDPVWYDLGGGWNVVSRNCLLPRAKLMSARSRAIRLAGSRTRTAFAGMYSRRQTTRR